MTIALAIAAIVAVSTFAGIAVRYGRKLGRLEDKPEQFREQLSTIAREYGAYRIGAEQTVAELKELIDDLVERLEASGVDARVVAAALSLREAATLQTARERASTVFAEGQAAIDSAAAARLQERRGLLGRVLGGGNRAVSDAQPRVDAPGGDVPRARAGDSH